MNWQNPQGHGFGGFPPPFIPPYSMPGAPLPPFPPGYGWPPQDRGFNIPPYPYPQGQLHPGMRPIP